VTSEETHGIRDIKNTMNTVSRSLDGCWFWTFVILLLRQALTVAEVIRTAVGIAGPVTEGVTVAKCPQNRNTTPVLPTRTTLPLRVGGLAVGTRDIPVGAGPGGDEDTHGWRKEEEEEEGKVICLHTAGVH